MAKKTDKTSFVCNECGENHARWVGKCTATGCGKWNTVVEFKEAAIAGSHGATPIANNKKGYSSEDSEVEILDKVVEKEFSRHLTGSSELDRVLGGGLTEGSVVLISGDPGAGKSTLLIAVMAHLSKIGSVLVNSGEENKTQIKNRSQRLGLDTSRVHIMTNGNVERMCQECVDNNHRFLLVDSIQVMFMNGIASAPGSVTQVRESAAYINRTAKKHGITVFLVVHSTKKEGMAGPQTLAHIGDATLIIECENDSKYRTLRAKKNRFGSADEIGTFAMTSEGMQDISNPSAIYLEHGGVQSSGNVVFASSEGRRTLLLNLQSLVTPKAGEYPQRGVLGVDKNRLSMLLAVMRTRMNVKIADHDIFLNVVGGIRITDPASDAPLVLAMLSSYEDKVLPKELIAMGEIGLSGEVRPVSDIEERIKEAVRNGFTEIIIPFRNYSKSFDKYKANITAVKDVNELKAAI